MIRKFNETDVDEIIAVWIASSPIAHPFFSKAFIHKEINNIREIYLPNTTTWVFANENGLDGFISMFNNEVGAIFVRPEKQGMQIGKKLMDFVSKFHDVLEVEVFKDNKIGRAFYDNYGFKTINEHMHEETQHELLRMKYIKS